MGYSSVFMEVLFLKQRKGDFQTSHVWDTSWHRKCRAYKGETQHQGTNPTDSKDASSKPSTVLQNSLKSQPVFCVIKKSQQFPRCNFEELNAHRALPVWMWPDFLAEHMWMYRKHFQLAQLPLSIVLSSFPLSKCCGLCCLFRISFSLSLTKI